jgi:DNA-binding MarR family transcriptional regulator
VTPTPAGGRLAADPLVALLARAVHSHGRAIRAGLHDRGFTDLPPSSGWVLAVLAQSPAAVTELGLRLDQSKQAVSRLTELLVQRGYAEVGRRRDHRQVVLRLTPRGSAASAVVGEVSQRIDQRLRCLDDTRAREFRDALIDLGAPDA